MELLLNSILNLPQEDIDNSRIELNMTEGKGGVEYIDKWVSLPQDERESGITDCSYWGWFSSNKRNFSPGQKVLSFIKIKGDEWLFVSASEILDVPQNSRAIVKILSQYVPLFGRLIIRFNKGNTYSRYVFILKNIMDNCVIKEILPCQYNGEQFEGYDRVHLPFGKLSDVFRGKIMPTYFEALKKVTGIYCLTDTHTGRLYIGSATGGDGVAQRWGSYLDSKHGDNCKLIALYKEKGSEYFEKYFTYTLIEYFGLSYDPERIKDREQYWKICLSTRVNGYNGN